MTVDNSCNQSTTKQRTPTLWLHLRPLFIKENPTKTYQIEFDISNPSCFTDVSTSEFRHPLNASSVFRSRENLKRLLINVITMLYCSFFFTATFTVVSFPTLHYVCEKTLYNTPYRVKNLDSIRMPSFTKISPISCLIKMLRVISLGHLLHLLLCVAFNRKRFSCANDEE